MTTRSLGFIAFWTNDLPVTDAYGKVIVFPTHEDASMAATLLENHQFVHQVGKVYPLAKADARLLRKPCADCGEYHGKAGRGYLCQAAQVAKEAGLV